MFEWNQYGLQDALSPVMEEFLFFHDFLMVSLIFISVVAGGAMASVLGPTFSNQNMLEGQLLEMVWTVTPALVLVVMAVPSLTLLYSLESVSNAALTMKVMGHQWYWSYEYTDFWGPAGSGARVAFDSYMVPTNELEAGAFRLLETDNRPALPFLTSVRVLVSSSDVLHSWAVPSLGVKLDAAPGRLNQTSFLSYRPGVAYGQCSEICGANHSFMPISLEFLNIDDFLAWVESAGE